METQIKGSLAALCQPIAATSSPQSSPSLSPATAPNSSNSKTISSLGLFSSAGSNKQPQQQHRDPTATEMKSMTPSTSSSSSNKASSLSPTGGVGGSSGLFPPSAPNNKCLVALSVSPYLDERSLVALMRSCRRMREIMSSDDVWQLRLKDMRVNVILVNRTSNFFRAFRSDIITLRGLEGFYDFESEESEQNKASWGTPVSAVKRVMLVISPAFLGFVTPVARVMMVVQYFGMSQEDVFEGTMRYSFPKRLFVMSTFLTRCPRQEGPRFDVVVARSVRKWGTQKPAHFESVRGGTRLIMSIAQSAQAPANGYLPSNELLTVSRLPREGEGTSAAGAAGGGVPPLPADPVGSGGAISSSSGSPAGGGGGSTTSSPPTSEKRFSLRSLLGRA